MKMKGLMTEIPRRLACPDRFREWTCVEFVMPETSLAFFNKEIKNFSKRNFLCFTLDLRYIFPL